MGAVIAEHSNAGDPFFRDAVEEMQSLELRLPRVPAESIERVGPGWRQMMGTLHAIDDAVAAGLTPIKVWHKAVPPGDRDNLLAMMCDAEPPDYKEDQRYTLVVAIVETIAHYRSLPETWEAATI
jgi:hypothetical protein